MLENPEIPYILQRDHHDDDVVETRSVKIARIPRNCRTCRKLNHFNKFIWKIREGKKPKSRIALLLLLILSDYKWIYDLWNFPFRVLWIYFIFFSSNPEQAPALCLMINFLCFYFIDASLDALPTPPTTTLSCSNSRLSYDSHGIWYSI